MTPKRPIHTIKRGAVEAAIWTNETKNGDAFYRVTFTRFYRAADGKAANSTSFGSRNLPDLILLASDAEAWMLAQEASSVDEAASAEQ